MKKKAGILLTCFIMMSYLAIAPILADLAKEFPNVSQSMIQLLITLPNLITLGTSLLAGKLVRYIYKKTIIVFGSVCYLISGLVPMAFHSNFAILLICSGIMGIGCGGMITCTAGVICDYFEGKERNQMMGLQGAFISAGGAVFSLLGGQLAKFGWHYAYYCYLLLIPCFIGIILLVPKGYLEKTETANTGAKKAYGKKTSISAYVWFVAIIGFIFYAFQNTYNTNSSLYIVDELQLGNTAQAGLATSVNTIAGIIGGVVMGKIMSTLKKYTVPFSFAIGAVGLLLTYIGGSLPLILIGGALIGFAFSCFTPASTCLASDHATMATRSMCIAIVSAISNFGSALSPYIVNTISGIFAPTVRIKYMVSAIAVVILTVVVCVKFVQEK